MSKSPDKPAQRVTVFKRPQPQNPEKVKFLREGEVLHSDFNKWFLVSNNLISERSINYDQSVSFIPEIKSPQNKFIGNLFEANF